MHFVLLFLAFMMGWSLVAQAAVNRNLAEHAGGAPLWASMLSAFVSAACLLLFKSRSAQSGRPRHNLMELCASSSAKAIKARGRVFLLRELF